MSRGLRRGLLGAGIAVVAVVTAAGVLLSLPGTQRALWRRAVERVASASGWRVSAGAVRLRLLAGRFEAEGLTAGAAGEQPVLSVRRLDVRWRWWALVPSPHRLDMVLVRGVTWDAGAPLPAGRPDEKGGSGWEGPPRRLEIGCFRIEDVGGQADLEPVALEVRDLKVTGSLRRGVLAARAEAFAEAVREGRRLQLGRLGLAARLTDEGLHVERLELRGRPLSLSASGSLRPPFDAPDGAWSVRAVLPPGRLLEFWSPAVAEQVQARGRLEVRGRVRLVGGRPVPELAGRGLGLSFGGLGLDRLAVRPQGEGFLVEGEGEGWGRVEAWGVPGEPLNVRLQLDGARIPPWVRQGRGFPVRPPRDLRVSGVVAGTVDPGAGLDGLRGTAALTALWSTGGIHLDVAGAGEAVEVRELRLRVPGARARVRGRAGKRLDLAVAGEVDEPAAVLEELARWNLKGPHVPVPGGRMVMEGRLNGPAVSPWARVQATWEKPSWRGMTLERLEFLGEGTLDAADLGMDVHGAGGTLLHVSGRLHAREHRGHAALSGRSADLEAFLRAMGRPLPLRGAVEFAAEARLQEADWSLGGEVRLDGGAVGPVALRVASAGFSVGPGRLEVGHVTAELAAGRVGGSLRLTGRLPDARAQVRLFARDLRPDVLLPAADLPLHGTAGLDLELEGPLAGLSGSGSLTWRPDQEPALLGTTHLEVTVAEGRLGVLSRRLDTAAGPLVLAARVPLGSLPRPRWAWPEAPGGAASVRLSGCGLEFGSEMELLGMDLPGLGVRADLEADLEVDPAHPTRPTALVRLPDLRLTTPLGAVTAEEPVTVRLAGQRLELAPLHLEGPDSSATLQGGVDLEQGTVDAAMAAELAPPLIRLALPTVRVQGPLRLHAALRGPLSSPTGSLELDHRGGRLLLQDPPVRISGLRVAASLEGGVLTIDEGSAEVNGGRVDLGGGWDPDSGQGVVAELEEVRALLPPGILTRWNGLVAVEPASGSRVRLAGDLELVGGMWDTPFDLLAAMGTGGAVPVASDDPLERVDVEMEIAGRSGILVENNLGRFQAVWRRLEVRGTLARPVISGSVELLPGGTLRVGARTLSIVRGSVELPPVPGAEPELEVLTRDPSSGGGGLRTVNLGDLVQAGAAASVGRIFGLEATAIEPVRVAAETETDPAARLTLGRRLGPHLSYFFSTNLAGTQDQTQVVQVGDWRALPGLYGQWISSTTGGDGWALLERLRWGGSARGGDAGGSRLGKVRLEGRWPVARWRLRRVLGLSAGQRWEPFLAFAARVRLERALASFGFPEARVSAEVTGDPQATVLHLRCEPGEPLHIRWAGDGIPAAVRRRVLALYTPGMPPEANRRAMQSALRRELAMLGYPEARVEVRSLPEGGLGITVERGDRIRLEGLLLEGVPLEIASQVQRWWQSPADQAAVLQDREAARTRLLRMLAAEGLPRARITGVRLVERGRKRAVVEVTADPGPRRYVAGVRIEGEDPLGAAAARDFPLRAGVPFRRSLLEAARHRLAHAYREAGYPDVRVRIAPEAGNVVLVRLDPGPRRVVEAVRFSGLRHLKESVLRRGVSVRQGQPLRESEVDRTLEAVAAFPPVEAAAVSIHPQAGEKAVVEVAVRERPRWTLGVGVRWSSDRGQQLLGEFDDEDLLGRGISARFRTRWGSRDQSAQLLLGVPPPPGGSLHFAFSGTFLETQRGDLTERDGVLTLEAWIQRGVHDQFRLFLQQRRAHLYETEPDPFFPFDVTVTTAAVGGELILDRRDDPLDPGSGWFFSVNAAYSARALGSDLPAVRSLATLSWALPLGHGWTLAQGLRIGAARAIEGELDTTQRFFAGGETSVRGFDRDWVGPVACFLDRCHPAGGGALLVVNQELRVPLARDLRGVVFLDAGQVWNSWSDAGGDLSLGVGLGIRYRTPLGPIRLDLAVPAAHRGGNSGLHVYLGIGQVF